MDLKNSNGTLVASRSFSWVQTSGFIAFSDPLEVEAWVAGIAVDQEISSFDYDLPSVVISTVEGTNVVSASARYQHTELASMEETFTELPRCWGEPNCYIQ